MKEYLKIPGVIIILLIMASVSAGDPLPKALPPVNAYSAGSGFAGVSIGNNPATIFWNPGGIGYGNQLSIDFSVAAPTLESPGTWSFFMVNSSNDDGSRIGLGLLRHHAVWDEESSYKSFTAILPLAHSFKSGDIPVGISVKVISESFDDEKWHYGLGFDAGFIWDTKKGYSIGYSAQNIKGSNLRAFASETWLGFSWAHSSQPLTFSTQVQFDKPLDWSYIEKHYSIGLDYTPGKERSRVNASAYAYGLRGGYKKDGDDGWLTVGIEVLTRENNNHIAYTMVVNPDGWNDRAYYLSYGYSIRATISPTRSPVFAR